ncbi:MAG: hypothetical protein GX281_02010 [Bacteroidales bacterium]|jgi:hypothetical protein|nr:hypothetical protein [Bacteroidales bacterium]NLK79485.1 hypothetical protein [Bacteroidales bacterium]HPX78783.1 hypothetical protein [Bacteroidales bacterium]HQB23569.1 hypothetical protein [Bacteroidales bacterium]
MNYKPVFLFILLFASSVLSAQSGPSVQNETKELRVTMVRSFHIGNVIVQGSQAQITLLVDRTGMTTRQTSGNIITLDQDFHAAELYLEYDGENTLVITNCIAPSNVPLLGIGSQAGDVTLSDITFHLEPPFEVSKSHPVTLYLGGTATLTGADRFQGNNFNGSLQISFIYENAEPL